MASSNPYRPVRFMPQGGMNLDDDPLELSHGDYQEAKNIHFLSRKGGSTYSVENSLGNTSVFTIPPVVTQNKVFRLDVNSNIDNWFEYEFFDANGNSIGKIFFRTLSTDPIFIILSALEIAIQNALGANAVYINKNTNESYITLEIITVPGWEYSIKSSNNSTANWFVVQEAIDSSLAGTPHIIGSFDLSNDLFIWSTTQRNLPKDVLISSIFQLPLNLVAVKTKIKHKLKTGDLIIINNTNVDGSWIVNYVDDYTVTLQNCPWQAKYASTNVGKIITNPSGIGEIGVATKDDNTGNWTYTRLLRSKEWNWCTKKQPKTYCERNNINASIYWTDNYNAPRRFYYQGAYQTDGALRFVDPKNLYEYDSIEEATRLLAGIPNLKLTFTGQQQTGGGSMMYAGNHRYCIRLLDANFNATLYTDLTNPISVYQANKDTISYKPPADIGGNPAFVACPKINEFLVEGIIPNLFKYVELVDIYYPNNGAPVGTTIRRDLLTQKTTQTIIHRGDELNTTTLTTTQLSEIQSDIRTALNIDAIKNHLVLSNTTSSVALDFSGWTSTFKHSILRTTIPSVGSPDTYTYRLGEYADPANVHNKMGYMHNEIYRFGCKLRLKNGYITESFWIDDIRIDTLPTNLIANPQTNPFNDRRIAGLPNYDLTDVNADNVYVAYVQFTNFNLDYVVGGIKVKDLVDEIIFERVDISKNEDLRDVLATGVVVKTCKIKLDYKPSGYTSIQGSKDKITYQGNPDGTYYISPTNLLGRTRASFVNYSPDEYFEFPGTSGWNNWYFNLFQTYYPSSSILYDVANGQQYAFFYCPDYLYGNTNINFTKGNNYIFNYGCPRRIYTKQVSLVQYGLVAINSEFGEYNGTTGRDEINNFYQVINPEDKWDVGFGGGVIDSTNNFKFYKNLFYGLQDLDNGEIKVTRSYQENNTPSQLFKVKDSTLNGKNYSNYFESNTGNTDLGLHYIQYLQNRKIYSIDNNKYGNRLLTKYIPTESVYTITKTSLNTDTQDVFGGDVFTQKTYVKNRIPVLPDNDSNLNPFTIQGGGSGFGFYSQNRVNSQMKDVTTTNKQWVYPNIRTEDWVEEPGGYVPPTYNFGYNIRQDVTEDTSFDPNLPRTEKQPVRIWYSLSKPQNAIADQYTSFLPKNFVDLDLSYGEITHHKAVNSELLTWQPLQVEQQYFESTGLITTNAEEVVLGSSGIMTRKGTTLSTYGTNHGFSVCIGKTQGGKDVAYWIDTTHGKYLRHGMDDGTKVLSDIHGMRSFFNNNFQYADLANTPADGEGICAVWDYQNSEVITTVRAHKIVRDWDETIPYSIGSVVYAEDNSTFGQSYQIYECIVSTTAGIVPTNTDYWKAIEHSDINYYNEFTFSFNEEKNKFTTFYSFLPKIYLSRGKSFLSPRPVGDENIVYEHLRLDSEYCTWYTQQGATPFELSEDAYIKGMCINIDANLQKHFYSLMVQSEIVPYRMDFTTKKYKSYLNASDFSDRGDQFVAPIHNDSQITPQNPLGLNDQDTSMLFGAYMLTDLTFAKKIYQKFYNFICKIREVPRSYRS